MNAAEWLRGRGSVQILELLWQTQGHGKPEISLENRRWQNTFKKVKKQTAGLNFPKALLNMIN